MIALEPLLSLLERSVGHRAEEDPPRNSARPPRTAPPLPVRPRRAAPPAAPCPVRRPRTPEVSRHSGKWQVGKSATNVVIPRLLSLRTWPAPGTTPLGQNLNGARVFGPNPLKQAHGVSCLYAGLAGDVPAQIPFRQKTFDERRHRMPRRRPARGSRRKTAPMWPTTARPEPLRNSRWGSADRPAATSPAPRSMRRNSNRR